MVWGNNSFGKNKSRRRGRKPAIPIVHLKEGINPWASYFKQQIYQKHSCIYGLIHGKVGSSKSYSMLSLIEQYDPDINLSETFYFSAGKMMKDIDAYYNGQKKAKIGKVWMLDEAGISVASHKHFDAVNKGLNAFMQVARHRCPILLATVPNFNFVSKGVRTMMNVVGETVGWSAETNTSSIALRILDYNGDLDKYYKKRIYVYDKSKGGLIPCNQTTLPKPSKRILNEYEKLKKEFTSDLFGNISKEIENYETKQEEKAYGKELTPKQDGILKLLERGRNIEGIATLQNISIRMVQKQMEYIKKKGYKLEPERDESSNKILSYKVKHPPGSIHS